MDSPAPRLLLAAAKVSGQYDLFADSPLILIFTVLGLGLLVGLVFGHFGFTINAGTYTIANVLLTFADTVVAMF